MYKFLRLCGIVSLCILSAPVFSVQNQRSAVRSQNAEIRNPTTETRSFKSTNPSVISSRNTAQTARSASTSVSNRSGVTNNLRTMSRQNQSDSVVTPNNTARATTSSIGSSMGDGYNTCRETYFTCMDQFCANKDDTYRRCVCSSRLDGLREMATKVSQTQGQLESFSDYNIDAISKTAKEVSASLTATIGESNVLADKSESAQKLAGISSVLGSTKIKSLATSGTLDIAGDIGSIWATPDFIGSSDISNMEGEKLYSQVHSQCLDLVASSCSREATLNMVVSAYGMYIEQDCNVVQASLEGKKTTATAAVRTIGRDMELARLENYDAHNSTEINDCIAQVRKDVTADSECGENYVHCLDVTGLYLNINTGEPIYSVNFFKLENQTSLDGDFMNSNTNRLLIAKLEETKASASRGLDTCRDVANDVWAEFKRQAIIEIYQAQQARVKQVRDECLSVVNKCYDEKISQLKNFANIDSQMLIGQSVATAESLCKEKLDSCSNVFGGGSAGLESLLSFVKNVGSAKISENCKENMDNYIHKVCAVTGDSSHTYPYSCRVRNPGSYDCENNRWLSSGSSCPEQSGSVYELLVKYARENCVRSDYSANEPLPSEVMEYINTIFDAVLNDMRIMLKTYCETYSGEWIDDGRKSNIEFYIKFVAASDYWGSCIKPYCVYQGDAWLDDNGVKRCCATPNSIAPEECNGSPSCECTEIVCPINAAINTSICDNSDDVISTNPPILGGCIGRNDSPSVEPDPDNESTWQLPYCKCSSNYYSIPHNYNTMISGMTYDVSPVDLGKCWPSCGLNSSWNGSCSNHGTDGSMGGPGDSGSANTGCLSKYCRCNENYKFVAASVWVPEGGDITPGAAAVLPKTLNNKAKSTQIKNNKSNTSQTKTYQVARAGGIIIDPLLTNDRCELVCPANSHADSSCTHPAGQPGCPRLSPPFLPSGCIITGCRCDNYYCSNGTTCELQTYVGGGH